MANVRVIRRRSSTPTNVFSKAESTSENASVFGTTQESDVHVDVRRNKTPANFSGRYESITVPDMLQAADVRVEVRRESRPASFVEENENYSQGSDVLVNVRRNQMPSYLFDTGENISAPGMLQAAGVRVKVSKNGVLVGIFGKEESGGNTAVLGKAVLGVMQLGTA